MTCLLLLVTAVAVPAVAQAASASQPKSPPADGCVHPYPCGDEWPDGLTGPFEPRPVEHVRVRSSTFEADGVMLDGWVLRPEVPDGVRVPVLLHSAQYLGECRVGDPFDLQCRPSPDDPTMFDPNYTGAGSATYQWGMPALELVERGYALAMFSVRGTGRSGGCRRYLSAEEQADQAVLVEWAGSRAWSNGRVALGGISFPAVAAWEAAVQNPEPLKTIVTAGIVSDLYTLIRTPQGAHNTYESVNGLGAPHSGAPAAQSAMPPTDQHSLARDGAARETVEAYPQHQCPSHAGERTVPATTLVGPDRDASFWDERRLIDRFPQVTAAVLLAQGFDDDGHDWQDDAVWDALDAAPKRRIVGQWAHDFPYAEDFPLPQYRVNLDPSWEHDQWDEVVVAWLDYWLKGIGSPERLGIVDYQDSVGTWRESASWPPQEAREEVLYLASDGLARRPDGSTRSFISAPNAENSYDGGTFMEEEVGTFPYKPYASLCEPSDRGGSPTAGLSYVSRELRNAAVIAGNPFVYLNLRSSQPGGLVTVKLVDIGPKFACDERRQPVDVRTIDRAAADLRFYHGNFVAEDFPSEGAHVRLDFPDQAYRLEPGHRLALTVSYGETHIEYMEAPFFPRIDVVGDGGAFASHLVVPFVQGGLGGKNARLDYPPRPFTPVP